MVKIHQSIIDEEREARGLHIFQLHRKYVQERKSKLFEAKDEVRKKVMPLFKAGKITKEEAKAELDKYNDDAIKKESEKGWIKYWNIHYKPKFGKLDEYGYYGDEPEPEPKPKKKVGRPKKVAKELDYSILETAKHIKPSGHRELDYSILEVAKHIKPSGRGITNGTRYEATMPEYLKQF